MTKSIALRLSIGAFLLGLGVYICFVSTQWLLEPYVSDIWVAIHHVIWLFLGWVCLVYSATKLYFTVKDMERQDD